MDRLLAYENAGLEPPMIVLGPSTDGPQDLLDEPMQLSLADKAKLGMQLDHSDGVNSEHLQWELRKALEKIHSFAGHAQPIGGVEAAENKPFDGMDPVSSALLMELAASVMPEKPKTVTNDVKYSPTQRKMAIKRWLEKRARRHLTSQTKYAKMKHVAVGKARCKGGKFIKKSERERLARLEQERNEQAAALAADTTMQVTFTLPVVEEPVAVVAAPKESWAGASDWQHAYALFARSEE